MVEGIQGFQTWLGNWRNANQGGSGHQGLMSKLTIDGNLYDIKDPAVDQLAIELDQRLNAIEGTVVDAQSVTFDKTSNGFQAANVQAAIEEALTKALALKGTQGTDAKENETIAGAKAYAEYLVNQLAGDGWTDAAKKVKDIIAELEGSSVADEWSTLVDKLKGMEWDAVGTEGQQGYIAGNQSPTVSEFVDHKISGLQSGIEQVITDNETATTAAITGLQSTKANKAAISTATVNNWSTSFANEELVWTNTQTTVYVPVNGQTL